MNKILKYGFITLGIMFLALIPPRFVFNDQMPVCIFRYLTGIECPLCGMTRAGYELMHLNLADAFRSNPVSFLLPLLVMAEIGYDIAQSEYFKRLRMASWFIFFASLAVLFIIRLISFLQAH